MIEWIENYPLIGLLLALVAGALAGFVNTLAGNGSAITIALLVFLGLPAPIANATNRVGVLVQSIIGFFTFQQNGQLPKTNLTWIIVPSIIGALIGTRTAISLSTEHLEFLLGCLMTILLIWILAKPKAWLKKTTDAVLKTKDPKMKILMLCLFGAIGFYGGLIQAGVGILLLSALVMGVGYSLVHANVIKVAVVFAFTIPALFLFAWSGQVNWFWGSALAVGQGGGAWFAARFASQHPAAEIWVRRLLIMVLIFAIVRFFHIGDLLSFS